MAETTEIAKTTETTGKKRVQPELKPCPFCGGEAHRMTTECGGFGTNESGVISCSKCGARGPESIISWQAIYEGWNKRV